MNIKQFKRRWVNSKVNPEMFYAPVQEQEINEVEPFIFIIEVLDNKCFKQLLNISSEGYFPNSSKIENIQNNSYYNFCGAYMYNIRNSRNELITPENCPEFFTDNPLEVEKLPIDLFLNKPPYIKIDWGDGNILELSTRKVTYLIEDSVCSKLGIVSYYTSPTFNNVNSENTISSSSLQLCHFYKETGIYTIKVYAYGLGGINISRFSIGEDRTKNLSSNTQSAINGNFRVLEVKQWGLYDRITLLDMHTTCFTDDAILPKNTPWYKYKKVRSLATFMYYSRYNEYNNNYYIELKNKIPFNNTWEYLGGDNFFHNFPKLIKVNSCFYGYFNLRYIPDFCFSDNIYLSDVTSVFGNCIINSIGSFIMPQNTIQEIVFNNFYYGNINLDCSTVDSNLVIQAVKDINLLTIKNSAFENTNCNKQRSNSLTLNGLSINIHNYINEEGTDYSISFNGTLRKIGKRAFKNCKGLRSIQIYSCYFFEELGEECFAYCTDLTQAVFDFNSPVFHLWGKDTFKGCKNLLSCYGNISPKGGLPLQIPEKLFYDVEFHNINWNFGLRYYHTGYQSMKESDRELSLYRFFQQLGWWTNPYLIDIFLKEWEPDNYQKLIEQKKTYPKNFSLNIGKDMFNKEEVQKLHDWLVLNNMSSRRNWGYNRFPSFFGEVISLDKGNNQYEYYNLNTGYAPNALWEVLKKDKGWSIEGTFFGQENYNKNNSIYTTPRPVSYENKSEIPYRWRGYDSDGHNIGGIENNFITIGYDVQK